MRRFGLVAKILGGVAAVVAVLVGVAAVMLNSSSVQNKMIDYATGLLQEKLDTQVKIDSVHVNFLTQRAVLTGLEVEDQQQRKMLSLDMLTADFGLWELLRRKVIISKAEVRGVRARLYKNEGEPANYQFLIDAFKQDRSPEKEQAAADKAARDTTKKSRLQLDIHDFLLADVDVHYNEDTVALGELSYHKGWNGKQSGQINRLRGRFDLLTKKGKMTNWVSIGSLTVDERRKQWLVGIDSLHYRNDNHLPRKNEGKPNRGTFDTGHLDVLANLQLAIDHIGKDTLHAELTQCNAVDSVMGFHLKDLRFKVGATRQTAHLADVVIQQDSTILQFAEAELQLPSKKEGRALAYSTSEIKGRTILRDISQPFAPVLGKFVMPLNLSVKLSGTDSTMTFKDIKVTTDDQRLSIAARGGITHLTDKEKLDIRFHVDNMTAKGNIKREIINQFVVKKFMMKQLNALGTIGYTGDIAILRKREEFSGLLRTAVGPINFNFALDGRDKYVSGSLRTSNVELGKALDVPDLGKVACDATFKFDISVPRTAKVRRQRGGTLPIGSVKANVSEAHYKGITVKDISANVESNGAIAQGNITQRNKHVDLLCSFSFDNTDAVSKMKVKPGVKIKALEKLGKRIEEQKAKKEEKKKQKAEKKAQKEAKKAQKAAKKKG